MSLSNRLLVWLLALAPACQHQNVKVRTASELSRDEQRDLLDQASDILGISIQLQPEGSSSRGVLTLDIHRRAGSGAIGRALVNKGCRRVAWSSPDPETIAHEIGHMLGLGHVDDPDNLMFAYSGGDELTDEQVDVIEHGAWELKQCLGS